MENYSSSELKKKISESTIHRLSRYFRALDALEKKGGETVSSKELARHEKLTPAQVRKDLSFFGSFGTRGLGYPVKELKAKMAHILGLDQEWKIALIGVGNVGSALVSYKEFLRQGFKITKLFDNDQRKIGSNHKGIVVSDIKNLVTELEDGGIEMVVICVPGQEAQYLVDDVVKSGVRAILNFAPVSLNVPEGVFLRNENISMELEYLSYSLVNNPVQK
jgi:redox-sensing transcriptional repressor